MKKNIISYATCLATCVAFYFMLFAISKNSAIAAEKTNFLKEYSKELSQVETYLNNISNLSAKFVQETSNKTTLEGKFFLSRPGKMRVEYVSDPKVVIVVNGSILAYHDVELDEVSHISTNTTPASFLTRENISFSAKDVEITNVKKSTDQIKISLVKKNRKEAGEFSLIFANNPLRFLKMEVKNDLDQIITVTLKDLNFSSELSKNLFIIKNKNLPQ
ncbi:MAG: outer membrane lipoprotein carrier protein LolA [Rickettsiales bacterium]|nr:outer membrane lipoprotein carrier protein LolA [Rickettsiales bacterium]